MSPKRRKTKRKPPSWRKVVNALIKICYRVRNKRGSHITLIPKCTETHERTSAIQVPRHKELKPGTLHTILARANLTKNEFYSLDC